MLIAPIRAAVNSSTPIIFLNANSLDVLSRVRSAFKDLNIHANPNQSYYYLVSSNPVLLLSDKY